MGLNPELTQPEIKERERSYKFSLLGSSIEVVNCTKSNELYLRDVFFPNLKEASSSERIRMEAIETTLERSAIVEYVESLPRDQVIFDRGYYYGEVDQNTRFLTLPELGFINFTFTTGDQIFHRFVGTGTHYALASYAKAHAFWEFARVHKEFMISHSSSVVDLSTGQGVVFSTSDRGDETRRSFGKTTLALTAVTRGGDRFAFASNDEVLFSQKDKALVATPFSNEISVMGSGLNQIFPDQKPELLGWHEKDAVRDELRYYTTHGALFRGNYRVSTFDRVGVWAFVSLDKFSKTCTVTQISDDEARNLFRDVIFDNRMKLATSSTQYLGEAAASLSSHDTPSVNADSYYSQLKHAGVRFIRISGSVDPDEIFPAISEQL